MDLKTFPVIDLVATGNNIRRLRMERGLTVRELQSYFGFEEPRAIYKWQKGESLPTVDNLYALGTLFEVPMDQILVPVIKLHIVSEQQAEPCCSHHFFSVILDTASVRCSFYHLLRLHYLLRDKSRVQLRTRKRSKFDQKSHNQQHMETSVWMQESV